MKRQTQAGFTLVELSLSIAFLGALVLMSTTVTLQILSIYNKGAAIKQISQAGRSLSEDISRASSSGQDVVVADNGIAGYLCVEGEGGNRRAYVWNSAEGDDVPGSARYMLGGRAITLARSDIGRNGGPYCTMPTGSGMALPAADISPIIQGTRVRILSADVVQNTADASLRKIVFWIGTKGDVPGMTPRQAGDGSWSCDGGGIGDFCAVSRFEAILYTPNGGGV